MAAENWAPINGPNNFLCTEFNDGLGGGTRRLIVNPSDDSQVFVVSNRGIYRSNNSGSAGGSVNWQLVLIGPASGELDTEFRGLEFMPGNPNVVYASGQDIYKSENSGNSWLSMTNELADLNLPADFIVHRINLEVSPAAPDRLYAYISGKENTTRTLYIYVYYDMSGTGNYQWVQLTSQNGSRVDPRYLGFAVSPVDPDVVFFGAVSCWRVDFSGTISTTTVGSGSAGAFHDDVHALEFPPDNTDNTLWCGHHGGIGIRTTPSTTGSWIDRSDGLQVATIWSFDDWEINPTTIITAHQDVGTNLRTAVGQWQIIKGGDGYSAQINDATGTRFFRSQNDLYRQVLGSNDSNEDNWLPFDPEPSQNNNRALLSTLNIVNHPKTRNTWWNMSEVFERKEDVPADPNGYNNINDCKELWDLKSDVSKLPELKEQWRRQITEIVISEADPDYVYAVIGGTDTDQFGNPPSPKLFFYR